jgi:hypothetical protein
MSAEVVDFAGLDAQAVDAGASTEVESIDSGTNEVETQESEQTEQSSSDESTSAGDETERRESAKGQDTGKNKESGPALPKTITAALKTLAESNPDDPNIKSAIKQLRDSFFGRQAYDKEFGSVTAAREVKSLLSEIAGSNGQPVTLEQAREAWDNHQGLITNINESDAMVSAGDPQILDNIWETLKSEGKTDSFFKLGAAYLDKMAERDENGYADAIVPHLASIADGTGLTTAINSVWRALQSGDMAGAKAVVRDIGGLLSEWKSKAHETKQANSEQSKIQSERQKWESEKQATEVKTLKESTARECDSYSNKTLGKALGPFLKMPFFKDFPRETLIDLGNGIKARMYEALTNDKTYQTQMKGQWGQKSPDKGKIIDFHRTTLDAIARDIVEQTIKQRYPGYAKGGTAAGRVAAAKAKSEATTKASAQSVATSKPIYIASKPRDLVRQDVVVGSKKYTSDDLTMLEIGGKGFIKGATGYRLVTWRR